MASGSLPLLFAALAAGRALAGQTEGGRRASRSACPAEVASPHSAALLQVGRAVGRSPRVGVVAMTRDPADFGDWARYHLYYVGVEHVFLRVENTPGWISTWDSLSPEVRARITVWQDFVDLQPANNYVSMMSRQQQVMDRAMTSAKEMGLDWLFHIDDDELIYVPSQVKAGEVLASVPHDIEEVHVPNLEAVYDSVNDERCFRHVKSVNGRPWTFAAYANGKSGARVASNMASWGPHLWKHADGSLNVSTLTYNISNEEAGPSMPPLALLHYESCLVSQWMEKFWQIANITEKGVEPPFEFYRESIARMQECQGKVARNVSLLQMQQVSLADVWQALPSDPNCTKSALTHLWAKFKTLQNPRISTEALIPIAIPWDKIVQ